MQTSDFLEVIRKRPVNLRTEDEYLFLAELKKRIPAVSPVEFHNATVFPEQLILIKRKTNEKICTRVENKTRITNKIKNFRRKSLLINDALWITDTWSTNYFHWFTDALPRLILAEQKFPGIKLLLPATFDRFEYIVESLKAFPTLEIIWLRNFQKAKVKQLFYVPHTAPTGNYNEQLLRKVRERLRNHFLLTELNLEKSTFISRQSTHTRKIINWDELYPMLKEYKIDPISFEDFNWNEQIRLSAESKLLIGVHGAGLTNMLFMQEGTNIIELRRKDDTHNNCYFSMASALNLNYYYMLCDVDDKEKDTQKNNLIVAPEEFNSVIKMVQ